MTTTNWTLDLPTEPSACIVLIKNISLETKEATIKDFFSFCGVIKAFEMKQDGEQHQMALVYFEKESAAKTATLLSQAVVDDSPIEVEPYYRSTTTVEPINATTTTNKEINDNAQQQQESKSVSHVMAELLASGYVLTESVINKGAEFDNKHGVSTTVNGYLSKMGINLTGLNQRKSAPDTTTVTGDNNAQPRSTLQPSRMQNLLSSKAGLKVQGIASRVAGKVSNVHEEAKRIAAEKKKETSSSSSSTIDHKPNDNNI